MRRPPTQVPTLPSPGQAPAPGWPASGVCVCSFLLCITDGVVAADTFNEGEGDGQGRPKDVVVGRDDAHALDAELVNGALHKKGVLGRVRRALLGVRTGRRRRRRRLEKRQGMLAIAQ